MTETTATPDALGHTWERRPGFPERCSRCKTARALGGGAARKCEPWPVKVVTP